MRIDKVERRQFQNCSCPPPPGGAKPWAFDVFEKVWSNSPEGWQFRWSNAPPASASKSVKSPIYQRLFKRISLASNLLFRCKCFRLFWWGGKLTYRGLFISIKLFIPESPQPKTLNCSNKTVNIGAMTRESGAC